MDRLKLHLEYVREKMIRSGLENGLQSPKTIRLSKQLDQILNQYQKHEKSPLIMTKK
ncbi:aspartyl-phosphate phosphatase Spo0E family protein [Ureibacillus thermosphaericus]|uniref:aspartyl-phosphate phosphatase Spo0E family protein n=1 Tax=Ureibacillus thermosphaericus TaxID=51173 RepID=UPI000BBC51B2|nr:aspartyl-phosphate phosphatase Spo0E family protein [Ureibacillus thermosphaericus]